jgi:hypothetical protein
VSLRRHQLTATAFVLPRVTSTLPVVSAAAFGIVVAATSSGGDATIVLRTRMAAMLVAAAAVAFLDDDAASTLGPSPTPLSTRRSLRLLAIGALVGVWWSLMLVVATLRTSALPVSALTRELMLMVAISAAVTFAAQRRSVDERGATAGALAAIAWFVLSFVPRVGWMPLPPDALDPGSARRLSAVIVIAVAAAVALSRDPASRRHGQ